MVAEHDLVLVVDFGSQYAQYARLIAKRVRDAGACPEIVPYTLRPAEILARRPKAIILGGGPPSVYAPDAPTLNPAIFEGDLPVFGICFGFQAMAVALGGDVSRTGASEFGRTVLSVIEPGTLLTAIPADHRVWMSHGDSVEAAPDGMTALASTVGAPVAAFESTDRRIAGVQWHPEILDGDFGQQVLERFLVTFAGCRQTWTEVDTVEERVNLIREKPGDNQAVCRLSGGDEAAVTATRGKPVIDDELTRLLVEFALLRKDDGGDVEPDRAAVPGRSKRSTALLKYGRPTRWRRKTTTRRRRWLVATAVAALLAIAVVAPWAAGRGEERGWIDGQRYGDWLAVFNGYGHTTSSIADGIETITLEPQAPESDVATHAGLVVSVNEFGDVEIDARVKTLEQLRANPNPWEVGWLLLRYSDPDHFYSLALKPNGWELSKQDGAYPGKQRFLATGNSPTFPIGSWHEIRIVARGNSLDVYTDNNLLTRFVDRERPYLRGSVGLYTEDARVLFGNVQATAPTG